MINYNVIFCYCFIRCEEQDYSANRLLWVSWWDPRNFWDLVGLRLGSQRSPKDQHLFIFNKHFYNFIQIYRLHFTFLFLLKPLSVSSETLYRIALHSAVLTCLTVGLGFRHGFTRVLAYSRGICRDGLTW